MFAVVTLTTLAIGIGANSAIFSVLDGILLKPLPYPHAEELISLDHKALGINMPNVGEAPFLYYTYREEGRTFRRHAPAPDELIRRAGAAFVILAGEFAIKHAVIEHRNLRIRRKAMAKE